MSGKGKKGGNQGGEDKKDFSFDFNGKDKGALTKEQQATLMPLLQQKLESSIIGKSSGYLESLPAVVQTRVKALKHLQAETDKLEDEFEKEESALIKKYNDLKAPFFARRSEIVTGKSEPKPEELIKKEGEEEPKSTGTDDKNIKGVPEFWLTALQHSEDFGELITEDDEGALKHLIDVTSSTLPGEEKPTPSFVLSFHFAPNDYFENDIISKKYILNNDDGDMIFHHTESTEIKWKAGKNLTKKMVQQQSKPKGGRGRDKRGGKGGNQGKPVMVEKDVPSFFRYFAPDPTDDEVEDEQDLQDLMESDYELGLTVRDDFIPNAVKFFTGDIEAPTYEEYGSEDEDDDEDGQGPRRGGALGEEEDYNSEEDEDFDPKAVPQGQQPECKQQ